MEKDSPFSSTGRRCIVTLMCIFVTAFVYAQQQKISVSIKELPLKEAISQIAEKALMNVAYSKEFVDTSRKVSLEVKDTDVSKALTLLLKGTNIGFRFLDDSILFYNKEYQNKTEPVDSQGEKKELYVKGKVTDECGTDHRSHRIGKRLDYRYNHRYQWSVFHQGTLWKYTSVLIRRLP